jgi:hypothetical protein
MRVHNEPRVAQLTPGYYTATPGDVQDLGIVESTFEGKTTRQHKIALVFDVETGNGSSVQVPKRVNVSANPRSTLYAINEAITGVASTDFDTDNLLYKPCVVQVEVRKDQNGNEWENIKTVMPPKKAQQGLG